MKRLVAIALLCLPLGRAIAQDAIENKVPDQIVALMASERYDEKLAELVQLNPGSSKFLIIAYKAPSRDNGRRGSGEVSVTIGISDGMRVEGIKVLGEIKGEAYFFPDGLNGYRIDDVVLVPAQR